MLAVTVKWLNSSLNDLAFCIFFFNIIPLLILTSLFWGCFVDLYVMSNPAESINSFVEH